MMSGLSKYRVMFACWIAPEVLAGAEKAAEIHRSAADALDRISKNFENAGRLANEQTEELYADTYIAMDETIKAKWRSRLGLPMYTAKSIDGEE